LHFWANLTPFSLKLAPITPVEVGPGYVLGREKLVTTQNCTACWACDGKESLVLSVYDGEGQLVSTSRMSGTVNVTLLPPSSSIAIVVVVGAGELGTDAL
jgi:hypothetical protein